MRRLAFLGALVLFILICAIEPARSAQQDGSGIDWQDGPVVGKLGDIGQISIPAGYRFTGRAGAQKLMELTQNPSDGKELGAIIPILDKKEDDIWFVIFEFDETGYVKDNEKDSLDANAILDSVRNATERANKIREQRSWPAFHVVGWSHAPYYDLRTHNLTWAILGGSQEQGKAEEQSINYSVRLLGRGGVMKADLVVSPNLDAVVTPQFVELLDGYSFVPGQHYSDWRPGDKVAEYGLTGLIIGGVAAAAFKTGLFAKFWKLILAGFMALVAFLKRLFAYVKRVLTGKASEEEAPHHG